MWNGDLAPTILDATGATAPFPLDGRSLLPFARSDAPDGGRAVLLEGPPVPETGGVPRYTGLRTRRLKYVEHAGGERELYDLARDPHELENLARSPEAAALLERLASRLARLRTCAGATCR